MSKKISVVIPCYNEEDNIFPIYNAVKDELLRYNPSYDFEVIFIDNKSKDNTRNVLRELCAAEKNAKAIFNIKNFGQNSSPYYGVLQSTGDCTILMAADFQDPPALIPRFLKEWENGNKIVIGHKASSKESKLMYFFRSVYYKMLKKLSDTQLIEHFTGFGLYDKSFVNILRDLRDPLPFFRGVVSEFTSEYAVADFEQPPRKHGKTNNNFFTLYDIAMLSFTSYTKFGMRLATFAGFFVAGLSFLLGLFYLIAKLLFWNSFVAGYAPTMIAVFFMGGVQLAFMGFMGEYIMAMNSRIMNRPLVVEEARLNFEEQVKQQPIREMIGCCIES